MASGGSIRRGLRLGVGLTSAIALWNPHAQASQEFPGAIQAAANIPCVPGCVLCHAEAVGHSNSYTHKKLGATLFSINGTPVLPHDTAALQAAFAKYKADPANAQAVTDLQMGVDPETQDSLCGPTYGCGAHIAQKAPPTDLTAPLWVVGALGIAALYRRKASSK